MQSENYYDILGVSKTASEDELKKAYRKLSMQYHPDKQAGKSEQEKKDAEEKFKKINAAYACLSDKEKRSNYDQFGSEDARAGFGGGFSGFDPMEFFHRMQAGFSGSPFDDDMFGGFSQSSHSPSDSFNAPEDGSHVQIKIKIPFKESYTGCSKEFEICLTKECSHCHGTGVDSSSKPETCNTCHGRGQVVHTMRQGFMMSQTISQCPDCHGSGMSYVKCKHCGGAERVEDKKTIKLKIPQGIPSGTRLRVAGCGHCGVKGGQNGNLYVIVEVEKSKVFDRVGDDIHVNSYVDPIVASVGGQIEVMSPDKKHVINIPASTTSGTTFIVKNAGMRGSNGNLVVHVMIEPLSNLTSEQKDILIKLKKSLNSKNTPLNEKLTTDTKAEMI